MPSIPALSNVTPSSATLEIFDPLNLDVTGGALTTLPEHVAYRLACVLCACVMPQVGLKDAYEGLAEIYRWNTRTQSPPALPTRRELFVAAAINEVKAPPMVFDEE